MVTFLLIVQTRVAASLVAVILMQRSEGGGLGVGGSSGGLMTARGAADFLTRATSILGALFIFLSISLAAIAGVTREAPTVDTSLAKDQPFQGAAPSPVPVQQAPAGNQVAPASNEAAPAVPIAQ